MGGQSSQSVRTTQHFYFGSASKKKQYGKDLVTITRPIMDREDYTEWKQKLDIVHQMQKDSLYVPESHEYQKVEKGGANCCCGYDSQVQMTLEDVSYLFSSELENRKKDQKFYPQSQLMLILYNLLVAGKEFQRKNLHFGDIRPKNILVTTGSQLKMVNVGSFPWEITSMEKVLDKFDNKTVFYFSPQEIQQISSKGYGKDKVPNSKTQAWSIGLTVLEAATLQSSETLYRMPKRELDSGELGKRMQRVSSKYRNLYPFLQNILAIEKSQRMTCGEAWASMRPYSEKITELLSFSRNISAENASIKKFNSGE